MFNGPGKNYPKIQKMSAETCTWTRLKILCSAHASADTSCIIAWNLHFLVQYSAQEPITIELVVWNCSFRFQKNLSFPTFIVVKVCTGLQRKGRMYKRWRTNVKCTNLPSHVFTWTKTTSLIQKGTSSLNNSWVLM